MQHITLIELNKIIKQTLDKNLEPSYWIVAEIGEMRLNQKGHCYLDLVEKEDNSIIAKSRASIWAYNYRTISSWFERVAGQPLKNGMNILANVVVSFHEVYGFCLVIRDIDPSFTLGERARRRQEVIDKLKGDGIFTMNQALQLPLVPQRVAVISSASAAGYGDFMDQLNNNRHGYHFEVKLFKAVMQGEEAVDSMINGLTAIFKLIEKFDLVVIIRGGGAQVDLDCFDTYDLAAHVAQFPLPVITGIGHDRDETITDLVAHTKLKTPTAVAEFLISGLRVFEDKLEQLFEQLHGQVKDRLDHAEHQLFRLGGELRHAVNQKLNRQQNKIDSLQHQLQSSSRACLKFYNEKLTYWQKNLELLDPALVLKRGYSLTVKDGKTIGQDNKLQLGDEITTYTEHYKLASKISKVDKNEQ
ncbi:MAG: exodeoxyribonuclease VII large subunit [Cyclobacteriaceae bacterium]